MTLSQLANQSFMGVEKQTQIVESPVTLIGGGLDIESALISLIGLGVKKIQHFDNTTSRKEHSILAPFSQMNSRYIWRVAKTISQWFPNIEYDAIAAPPIEYLITEHNPTVILSNSQHRRKQPVIYTTANNSNIILSKNPIRTRNTSYDIHTKLISGSLAADEARKQLVTYHKKEEIITQQTVNTLTKYHVEKTTAKHPLIIGAGGIGTYTALAQTLHGTKQFTIIDPDIIEETNLNRQLFYTQNIAKPKATTLAHKLNVLNPFTKINAKQNTFSEYIRTTNTKHDLLFCCTDNYSSRLEIANYCEKNNIRLIEAGCTPTTAVVSEYVPNITQTITQKRQLIQATDNEKKKPDVITSCAQASPSVITPNLIAGVLQSYFSQQFIDSQNTYHRLQKNFCFTSHLATKFYEE